MIDKMTPLILGHQLNNVKLIRIFPSLFKQLTTNAQFFYVANALLSMDTQAEDKKLQLVWQCHQLGFLVNRHLPCVSRQSANDKGDTGLEPGVEHRSPGINFRTEENSGKPQLGDRLMNAVLQINVQNRPLTSR